MGPHGACSFPPPQPGTLDHFPALTLYYGRPLSLGIRRHFRYPPRYGASRHLSTGLYGPVTPGTPACPRPWPALCTPVHLIAACGAHVARCVCPPMPKTPQYISPLPPCALPRRRSTNRACHSVGAVAALVLPWELRWLLRWRRATVGAGWGAAAAPEGGLAGGARFPPPRRRVLVAGKGRVAPQEAEPPPPLHGHVHARAHAHGPFHVTIIVTLCGALVCVLSFI